MHPIIAIGSSPNTRTLKDVYLLSILATMSVFLITLYIIDLVAPAFPPPPPSQPPSPPPLTPGSNSWTIANQGQSCSVFCAGLNQTARPTGIVQNSSENCRICKNYFNLIQ